VLPWSRRIRQRTVGSPSYRHGCRLPSAFSNTECGIAGSLVERRASQVASVVTLAGSHQGPHSVIDAKSFGNGPRRRVRIDIRPVHFLHGEAGTIAGRPGRHDTELASTDSQPSTHQGGEALSGIGGDDSKVGRDAFGMAGTTKVRRHDTGHRTFAPDSVRGPHYRSSPRGEHPRSRRVEGRSCEHQPHAPDGADRAATAEARDRRQTSQVAEDASEVRIGEWRKGLRRHHDHDAVIGADAMPDRGHEFCITIAAHEHRQAKRHDRGDRRFIVQRALPSSPRCRPPQRPSFLRRSDASPSKPARTARTPSRWPRLTRLERLFIATA